MLFVTQRTSSRLLGGRNNAVAAIRVVESAEIPVCLHLGARDPCSRLYLYVIHS
jgi:hypothetical protein